MAPLPRRALMPVVHAETEEQALRNTRIALDYGAHGVWLINHAIDGSELLRIVREARARFSSAWLGVNLLDRDPDVAFHALGILQAEGVRVDGLWADNPMVEGANPGFSEQDAIAAAREASGWEGEYYGGVAFKYLDQPADLPSAVRAVRKWVDVVVTTGPGTGQAAAVEKVKTVSGAAEGAPVGLASGVTHENLAGFLPYVQRFIVATSLCVTDALGNRDDANLDGAKVERMRRLLDRAS